MDGIEVGGRVEVSMGGMTHAGIVRIAGEVGFASGDWVGVELDEAGGKNDGSVKGVRYFTCEKGRGIFVRPPLVIPLRPEAGTATSPTQDSNEKIDSQATASAPNNPPELSPRDSSKHSPAPPLKASTVFTPGPPASEFVEPSKAESQALASTASSADEAPQGAAPEGAALLTEEALRASAPCPVFNPPPRLAELPTSSNEMNRSGSPSCSDGLSEPPDESLASEGLTATEQVLQKAARKAEALKMLAEAMEEHDVQQLKIWVPQAEALGISERELQVAKDILNYEEKRQLALRQDVCQLSTVLWNVVERMEDMDARLTTMEASVGGGTSVSTATVERKRTRPEECEGDVSRMRNMRSFEFDGLLRKRSIKPLRSDFRITTVPSTVSEDSKNGDAAVPHSSRVNAGDDAPPTEAKDGSEFISPTSIAGESHPPRRDTYVSELPERALAAMLDPRIETLARDLDDKFSKQLEDVKGHVDTSLERQVAASIIQWQKGLDVEGRLRSVEKELEDLRAAAVDIFWQDDGGVSHRRSSVTPFARERGISTETTFHRMSISADGRDAFLASEGAKEFEENRVLALDEKSLPDDGIQSVCSNEAAGPQVEPSATSQSPLLCCWRSAVRRVIIMRRACAHFERPVRFKVEEVVGDLEANLAIDDEYAGIMARWESKGRVSSIFSGGEAGWCERDALQPSQRAWSEVPAVVDEEQPAILIQARMRGYQARRRMIKFGRTGEASIAQNVHGLAQHRRVVSLPPAGGYVRDETGASCVKIKANVRGYQIRTKLMEDHRARAAAAALDEEAMAQRGDGFEERRTQDEANVKVRSAAVLIQSHERGRRSRARSKTWQSLRREAIDHMDAIKAALRRMEEVRESKGKASAVMACEGRRETLGQL